jgi:hypothetical protein
MGYSWIAATVWAVGLTALLCDHLEESRPVIVGMRALFGIATSTAISGLLTPAARILTDAPAIELHLFVRWVSRWVYVLLYLLAAARMGFYFYELWQSSTLSAARQVVTPVHPLDDFLFYIVCCVLPLWVARALAIGRPFAGAAP